MGTSSVQRTTGLQANIDYRSFFQNLPGLYMAFLPDDPNFTIVDLTKEQAKASLVHREDVIGKPMLEVFPDMSEDYLKTGKTGAIDTFKKVLETKQPVDAPLTRYDIKDAKGNIVVKYWKSTAFPLLDEDGNIVLIYSRNADMTNEMEAAAALDETRQQLRDALTVGRIGTWRWDVQTNKVIGDATFAALFNMPVKEAAEGLDSSAFIEGLHPDDRERVKSEVYEAMASGETFESEYRTVGNDKATHWVLARGRIERNDQGKVTGFPGAIIDITQRKTTEAALQVREQELQFMADSMPQLVWVARPDGYHEYYNQQWYVYTGTEPGSTDGEGWNALFHPDDQARALKVWRQSLKTGAMYEIEYRLWNASSKEYRWVVGRALPLRDDKGKITKWYGTCTDIHDHKVAAQNQEFLAAASKELASSLDYKKTLQTVAKLMVPGVADWGSIEMLDENGQLNQVAVAHKDPAKVKWAKEYRRQEGPPDMDAPTGAPNIIRTGKPEFYPIITDEMLVAAAKNKEQLKLIRDLGFSSAMSVPLRIRGEAVGVISFILTEQQRHYTEKDLVMAEELAGRASLAMTNASLYQSAQQEIEHREKLEAELRVANQELEGRVKQRTSELEEANIELQRSNAELQDFAYVASHDLQEPLRKIQAFSNLLESEYTKELGSGKDYVVRMRKAAFRMSTLIEDLLAFSRVSTKAKPFERVNLQRVAEDVVGDLENRIESTDGKVVIGKLPIIYADQTQMRQLLQNLIGNALKFHKPDESPVVKIASKINTAKDGKIKYCTLSVSDNGVGFDEKYLDRIFSVFQRLHGKDEYEGTGIGLAVVRKIVERHKGTVTATSKLGKGSTFIIKLPMGKKGA